MARKKAPQNKAMPAAPENKEPSAPEEETNRVHDLLTELSEKDAQLRRLLKAESNEWAGTIGRLGFHNMADDIRAELRGEQDVDMGEVDD